MAIVWLPDLLPGCPDTFKCVCGLSLCRNGYNDDPIARRVRATPSDFYLFMNRFICDPRRTNVTGCGMNFQGIDLHIVSQLPRFVQMALPVPVSTHRVIPMPEVPPQALDISFGSRGIFDLGMPGLRSYPSFSHDTVYGGTILSYVPQYRSAGQRRQPSG
ncbi:hypothetical protein C8R47DRAFT_12675 [Mycena vitilis]|nr:hypothetical protein C8R47DRAFT_12675 [Mycena vitilis]